MSQKQVNLTSCLRSARKYAAKTIAACMWTIATLLDELLVLSKREDLDAFRVAQRLPVRSPTVVSRESSVGERRSAVELS